MILILTVAAILAPLLLLGLKTGVVWMLRESLLRDPRTLEVIVYGNTRLDHAWLDGLARRPDVAFLIPKTRVCRLDAAAGLAAWAVTLGIVLLAASAGGHPSLPHGSTLHFFCAHPPVWPRSYGTKHR